MSIVAMREHTLGTSGVSLYSHVKIIPLFLLKCLGFTFQSSNVGGGRSFTSTEKEGTNGSLSNSTYVFTDAVASAFTSSDVNKYLLVADATNPKNTGVYLIRRAISATQLEIDFAGSYGEYPISATGLSWWLVSGTYQMPNNGEYVRMQSPHSSGWALEINKYSSSFLDSFRVKVSVDGLWGSNNILGTDTNPCYLSHNNNGPPQMFYSVVASSDASWVHFVGFDTGYLGAIAKNWTMVSIALTDTIETHDVVNRIGLFGYTGAGYLTYRVSYSGLISRYISYAGQEVTGLQMDMTYGGWASSLTGYPARQANRRVGNKYSIFKPPPVFLDINNAANAYEIYGYPQGSIFIPSFLHGVAAYPFPYSAPYKTWVPLSVNTAKDYIHLDQGICIPWTGIGPQYP